MGSDQRAVKMPGSLVIINTGLAFFMVYSLTLTDAKTFLIETKDAGRDYMLDVGDYKKDETGIDYPPAQPSGNTEVRRDYNAEGRDYYGKKETTLPKEENIMGKKETTLPKEENIMAKKETVPKEENIMAKKETTMPKEEIIMPKEEIIMPKEEIIMPKKETTMPKEEIIMEEIMHYRFLQFKLFS